MAAVVRPLPGLLCQILLPSGSGGDHSHEHTVNVISFATPCPAAVAVTTIRQSPRVVDDPTFHRQRDRPRHRPSLALVVRR